MTHRMWAQLPSPQSHAPSCRTVKRSYLLWFILLPGSDFCRQNGSPGITEQWTFPMLYSQWILVLDLHLIIISSLLNINYLDYFYIYFFSYTHFEIIVCFIGDYIFQSTSAPSRTKTLVEYITLIPISCFVHILTGIGSVSILSHYWLAIRFPWYTVRPQSCWA